MGTKARTTQRRTARSAAQPTGSRSPARLIAIALVAAFGGAAGAVLGAALYNTTQNTSQQTVDEIETAQAVENEQVAALPAPEPAKKKVVVVRKTEDKATAAKEPPATPANTALATKTTTTPQLAAAGFVSGTQIASARAFLPAAPGDDNRPTTIASARFDTAFASLDDEENAKPVKKKKMTIPSLMEESVVRVDSGETGSIVPPEVAVEVAETEAEIAEMEKKMAALDAENFNISRPPALPETTSAIGSGMVKSKARKWVNLRAEPTNAAPVLDIVPAKASILADQNCTRWCGVVYKGQKGYIYRTFIQRPERSSQPSQLASADSDFKPQRKAEENTKALDDTAKSVAAYPVTEAEKLGYKKGRATAWVNMRARRSSKSKVLAIVPQNAKFMAETNCRWCRVVYGDKKGYVYKSFIRYDKKS